MLYWLALGAKTSHSLRGLSNRYLCNHMLIFCFFRVLFCYKVLSTYLKDILSPPIQLKFTSSQLNLSSSQSVPCLKCLLPISTVPPSQPFLHLNRSSILSQPSPHLNRSYLYCSPISTVLPSSLNRPPPISTVPISTVSPSLLFPHLCCSPISTALPSQLLYHLNRTPSQPHPISTALPSLPLPNLNRFPISTARLLTAHHLYRSSS
jgi:hypothetical protein